MAANPSSAAGVCTDAIRTSPSRTEGGATGLRTSNAVTSTTKGLRVAYPSVECNIPLIS